MLSAVAGLSKLFRSCQVFDVTSSESLPPRARGLGSWWHRHVSGNLKARSRGGKVFDYVAALSAALGFGLAAWRLDVSGICRRAVLAGRGP